MDLISRSGGEPLSGTGGVMTAEVHEEETGGEEIKLFVALPGQHKNGKSTLVWALRHIAAMAHGDGASDAAAVVVVVAHVHVPAQLIPVMGSKFHASKLRPEQVSAYRQYERRKVDKHLDEYIRQCSKMKVKGKKLVIENENVAKGITELVSLHNVTKLVMGAAADKHYSRNMKAPKSKTALAAMQNVDPSCQIWFVCKEHLIFTREIDATRSPLSILSVPSKQPNRYARNAVYGRILRSMSEKVSPLRLPSRSAIRRVLSRLSMENISVGSWDSVPRESFPSSYRDEGSSNSSSFEIPIDDVFAIHPPTLAGCGFPNTPPCHDQGDMDYQKEGFDVSLGRQKTEEELISYHEKAKKSEYMSSNEAKQKKEVEEALAKANKDMQLLKEEMDALKHNRDDFISKLSEVSEQKIELEQRVTEYDGIVKDLEDMVAASRSLIDSHQAKLEQMKHERDSALKYAEEMRTEKENMASSLNVALNTEFSLSELQQATRNFSDTRKLGEGGFGCVYRGLLHNRTVAIKVLHSQNLQGQSQFQQEVAVLSRVRHPNLVTLVGCCSEASALVYEFLPNGSLEDRLACRNNTPPLTWQVRTRIIGEICSALVFLHSDHPHPIIHGDLKPANILLDADLISKLSDFGISCLLTDPNTLSTSFTNPRGTFAYMDPEFLTTGILTAQSDVYALGIVILRLVTGMPPVGIARKVEDALEKGEMELLVDRSAGEWPFAQAEKLMLLGLQCAEISGRRRPDRMNSVWRVVEPLVKSASLSIAAQSFRHLFFSENHTPFYFICPISQEVMRNPHIAADGFTYEAEAIKGWLDSGHDTSPMTKLALVHRHIAPNYALRSAIEEYMQQQQQQC